jgi:hypothetical protein
MGIRPLEALGKQANVEVSNPQTRTELIQLGGSLTGARGAKTQLP